ncbi:unnamed protein product [Didymodactylos carnosus]|uniref:Uncharacterized protein n=1 Tax=Didymodactylos carnosus TaxID=1234261 RepID=A0A8S2CNY7_9BILA|nr:unnamed protein product [Didymodactylos carnosus]CAF3518472.1 unnamed protein product [Didymodactylos carnosus]
MYYYIRPTMSTRNYPAHLIKIYSETDFVPRPASEVSGRPCSYDTVSQNTHLVSDLHIMMGGKSCATSTCAQIFHDRVVKTFTSILNKTTPFVHYEENSEIFHFLYILPSTCNSNVSIIYADGSVISSLLARLLAFQQSHSVYSVSTSSTVLRTSVIA